MRYTYNLSERVLGRGTMTEHKINISAVAWPEGDQWVIQGIEYDIAAHAASAAEVPKAFSWHSLSRLPLPLPVVLA